VTSTDLLPGPGEEKSALGSLLDFATPYKKAGAVIQYDLLQFGLYGSVVVIVTGLVALLLPGTTSIRHSNFYWVFGSETASVVSLMRALAIPAIISGGTLLMLDAWLMLVRTSARWRSVVVMQAAIGGVGGVICTVFLALVILNLAIWIALMVLALLLLGTILGMVAGG
jgi:hypothetical protein